MLRLDGAIVIGTLREVVIMGDGQFASEMIKYVWPALIGLLSGAVGWLITKSVEDRKNSLKYITEERQKWRGELRTFITELYKRY